MTRQSLAESDEGKKRIATRPVLSGTLLAPTPYAVVLADARSVALLAAASYAVVLAEARAASLLTHVFLAVVLGGARPSAFLAHASEVVCL